MLFHLLKSSLRAVLKDVHYSLVNLMGLVIGMAVFIIMIEYVYTEWSFDRHFDDHDRIFRITTQKIQDGELQEPKSSASVCLAPFLLSEFDAFDAVAQVHKLDAKRLTVSFIDESGQRNSYEETRGFHADEYYFEVFSSQMLMGNPATALARTNSIVLTESLATKYFGDQNPIGKRVTLVDDFEMDYLITGVVEDVPLNAHFQYDFLISSSTFVTQHPNWRWHAWDWDYFHTYVKVRETTDVPSLEKTINEAIAQRGKEVFEQRNYSMIFSFQLLTDIHLYSKMGNELGINGFGDLLAYILVIAVFILLMAWVNYLNLTSARATLRARELGIRKVAGASRSVLTRQLLTEAWLLNMLALGLAVGVVFLTIPWLTELVGYELPLMMIREPLFWLSAVSVSTFGAFVSGLYPALIMTRLNILTVLRGSFKHSIQGAWLRRFLVFFQFSISLVLIMASFNIYRQISFLQQRELGFNPEHIVSIHMPKVNVGDTFWSKFDVFKSELLKHPGVTDVACSSAQPGMYLNHVELFKKDFETRQDADLLKFYAVDYDLLSVFGLSLISGRDFDPSQHEQEFEVILNEAAAKSIGYVRPQDAVGQPVTWIHNRGHMDDCRVVGVIEDFDQRAMSGPEPSVFFLNRDFDPWNGIEYFNVKVRTEDLNGSLQYLEEQYEGVFAGNDFSYFFVDDRFNQDYQGEIRFGKVFGFFAIIGLVIANLGLLALSSYLISQRTKEISIRKVLGAQVGALIILLTRQYIGLILLAAVISVPLTYMAVQGWMDKFPYRSEFSWYTYLLPVICLGLVALCTIGFQTFKASLANPIRYLRSE